MVGIKIDLIFLQGFVGYTCTDVYKRDEGDFVNRFQLEEGKY